MKRFVPLLSVMLVLCLLAPLSSAAAEDGDPAAVTAESFEGEVLFEGAPDADAMEQLDEYALVIDDVPVLSVERTMLSAAIPDGFFSVDFTIPETTESVFLTGLTSSDVEEIQDAIIASYVHGQPFNMTDLGFIDAEKTASDYNDDNLCWAAATSNMLTYAGWAGKAGFSSSDDVFELFIDSFTNEGGHAYYGADWFLNKHYAISSMLEGASQLKPSAGSNGGYFMDYPADLFLKNETIEGVDDMREMIRLLKEGNAASINVRLYNTYTGTAEGGHAMTLWGCICDEAVDEDNAAHYLGLFIGDSDSDKEIAGDRRLAPDVMHYYPISYDAQQSFFSFPISYYSAVIVDYISLTPYSDDLPYETDPTATRSRETACDLTFYSFTLSDDNGSVGTNTVFVPNTCLKTSFAVSNGGSVDFSGKLSAQISITDAGGETVYSTSKSYNITLPSEYYSGSITFTGDPLPVGDYTLTVVLNQNHTTEEAYYVNNTRTFAFKVRDVYLVGDADGDGEITVIDATKVQRHIAGLPSGMDDAAVVRADVNGDGVNIMDATAMQRAAAKLDTHPDVGTSRFYP